MTTLWELEQSAISDLREWMDNNFDDGDFPDPDDEIFEITDSSVPVMNYDLLQLAADNLDLAVSEPELGPAFDGSPTPINIIAANVFEYIEGKLWEAFHEIKEEMIQEYEDNLEDENEN